MLSNFVECFDYDCSECGDLFPVNYEIVWDDNGDECQDIDWPNYCPHCRATDYHADSVGDDRKSERQQIGIDY
jgi:hypothetical protein